jgi:electron transport complex protein RnfB
VAVIEEPICIGCTKCIQVCPVDAIVGASKLMHTVIASWCTGCELCIPACPVDCIVLEPVEALPDADLSRDRHEWRTVRLARDLRERAARLAAYE